MGIVGATIRQDAHVGISPSHEPPFDTPESFIEMLEKFQGGEFTVPEVLNKMYQVEVELYGKPYLETINATFEPNPQTHPTLFLLSQIYQLYKEDCLMTVLEFTPTERSDKAELIADIKGSLKDTDSFIAMCVVLKVKYSQNTQTPENAIRSGNIRTAFDKLTQLHAEIVGRAIKKPSTSAPNPV